MSSPLAAVRGGIGLAGSSGTTRSGVRDPNVTEEDRGLPPLHPGALAYDKPLCASLDGFTFHAAT
jgi:hypothetical protein